MSHIPHKRKGERGLNVRDRVEPTTVVRKDEVTEGQLRDIDVLLNGNRAERRVVQRKQREKSL